MKIQQREALDQGLTPQYIIYQREPMPLKLTELEQRYTLIVGLLESNLLQFPSLVSLSSLLNHQEHKIKQLYIFIIKTTRVLVIKLLQFLGEKEVQHFMV